jgi:hypothetical protein
MNSVIQWPDVLPDQKRELLIQRIYEVAEDDNEREQMLSELETVVDSDADEFETALFYLSLPSLP